MLTQELFSFRSGSLVGSRLFAHLLTGNLYTQFGMASNIAQTEGYTENDDTCEFSVFRSDNGFFISPSSSYTPWIKQPNSQDKILEVLADKVNPILDNPEEGIVKDIFITPGAAGKQFFTDPVGKPLEEVSIKIYDGKNWERTFNDERVFTGLIIFADYSSRPDRTTLRQYRIHKPTQTLIINHKQSNGLEPMSDAYAIHLFNTIDALIPGAQPPTPQNERRTTPEMQIAQALPAPGRRAAL